MKKFVLILLAMLLCFSAALAEETPVRVMALKGPTAMGMVKMMEAEGQRSFEIVGAIDEVPPAISQGRADIAAVPANLASVLCNKTEGAVQVLAINTLGVLYIVENGDEIRGVQDLRGRTIYASGKGATPEYALNAILAGNGLDPERDVTIEWKSEHAECLAALLANGGAAMLPQPFVTTAQMKNEGIRTALDLTREWDALQQGSEAPSALLTGVVIVRRAFAEEHKEAVDAFLADYAESVAWVNANVDEAAELVGKHEIVPAAVAKKAIPACNIVCITGDEMEQKLSGYLAVLFGQNPQSVGGKLPDGTFYYKP